jgi:small subunit ribosomal protein S9
MNSGLTYYGVGRDKNAVARVFIQKGSGKVEVNSGRSLEDYFKRKTFTTVIMSPLHLVEMADNFDIKVNVKGGGNSGQADAVRLAISKALVNFDSNLKTILRGSGFITTDKRKVERKKPGRRKARKQEQYSKR